MRKTEVIKWCKTLLMIIVPVIMLSSCNKDDEVKADYMGTWSALATVSESGNSIQCKDKITFTQSGFSDLLQLCDPSTGRFIDYMKLNGTMAVSGNTMNLKTTEIGVSTFDLRGYPTGSIIMYKEGSDIFTSLFSQTGQSQAFKSVYEISGSKMTLKTDNNNDGDYTDAGETTVYTKE
ncbi:hypothetical protein [Paludibacter sp.]|uniref:hypothetical protein n=1 Tax=Paludibacter sp. TaxID=1898105 RepID=UPI001355D861|nr:hypothetical protein [Paludibacter sp.]MTK52947.1 hypothetical protein [Paludibacter sp.]